MCDHGTAGCTRFCRCELCVRDGIAWLAAAIARRAVVGPESATGAESYAQRVLGGQTPILQPLRADLKFASASEVAQKERDRVRGARRATTTQRG